MVVRSAALAAVLVAALAFSSAASPNYLVTPDATRVELGAARLGRALVT